MLTPQQIQQAKSANGVTTSSSGKPMAVSQSAPLDENSFANWSKPSVDSTVSPKTEDPNAVKIGNTTVIGGAAGAGVKKFGEGFNQTLEGLNKGDIQGVGRGILNQAAGGIETAFSPITTAFNVVTGGKFTDVMSKIQKDLESNEGAGGPLHELVKKVSDNPTYQKFAMDNPHAGEIFNNLMTVGTSFLGAEKGAEVAGKLKTAATETLDTAKTAVGKTKEIAGDLKDKALGTPTKEEALGKVSQATKEELPSFSRGMEHMGDTKGIKTYEEFSKSAESKIKSLADEQNVNLSKDTSLKRIAEFEQDVNGIKGNHVERALDELKTYYEKTNNTQGLSKIKEYMDKANSESTIDFATNEQTGGGLTVKDVNDIAKLHGKDLSGFNANGELASGLTKQGAENTRKGLKATVENTLKDPEAKKAFRQLDGKMSDVFTVKDLVTKEAEAVQKLSQKMENPNILQKASALLGKAAKFTGFKAFLKELGLGKEVGSTSLNAVEREARLPKLLEIINEKTDAGFVDKLVKLYEESGK